MARYIPKDGQDSKNINKREAVVFDGKVINYLNPGLLDRQKVSTANIKKLKELHCLLYITYQAMEATEDRVELKRLAAEVTRIEFAQQKAWGFPQDINMHLWYDVPQCSCPKLDNQQECRGTTYKIVSSSCLVHS